MVLGLPARQTYTPGEITMNKFTTFAAICLLSLMATASHAVEEMSEEGMMGDNMHESMENGDMKTDDISDSMDDAMSDSMDSDMQDDSMSKGDMEMEEYMESEGM